MKLVLIKPNIIYFKEYKEMMDEWIMEGSRISPWPLHIPYHTLDLFNEMLKRVNNVEKGIDLGGYSSSTTYWLLDSESNKLIGASNIRHELVGESSKYWGHIGYGIRPSERKKGYGTELLKLTLVEAKKFNFDKVYLGAYEGNKGSWRIMEKCNSVYENTIIEEETGLPIKRYVIRL